MKQLLLFLAMLAFAGVNAQYNFELGIQAGGSNYLGDIGGKQDTRRDFVVDMHLQQTKFAGGMYARYRVNKRFAVNTNLSILHINDRDSESTNPARVARNLNFRNRLYELGLRGEVTLLYDNDVSGRGYYNPDFWVYGFAGISGYHSNPQAKLYDRASGELTGDWVDLRPLTTEGVSYSAFGVAIPAGLGFHFTFNRSWRVGWELSWRTTFSDYLDDISGTYVDPESLPSDVARQFASQADPAIIASINEGSDEEAMSINDHRYQDHPDGIYSKRGDQSRNDSYLSTTLNVGYVFKGKSKFYRKKYSWLRNRSGARRSRAKF